MSDYMRLTLAPLIIALSFSGAAIVAIVTFQEWLAYKDAPLNEQISLSAVLLKVSNGGEYCFERADKTYCVRRTK